MMFAALALFAATFQPAAAPAAPAASQCVAPPVAKFISARGLSWYLNNENVTVKGRKYAKYGLPRVLVPGDVKFFTSHEGGHFYGADFDPEHEVIYLLVDIEECSFQPYQAVSG